MHPPHPVHAVGSGVDLMDGVGEQHMPEGADRGTLVASGVDLLGADVQVSAMLRPAWTRSKTLLRNSARCPRRPMRSSFAGDVVPKSRNPTPKNAGHTSACPRGGPDAQESGRVGSHRGRRTNGGRMALRPVGPAGSVSTCGSAPAPHGLIEALRPRGHRSDGGCDQGRGSCRERGLGR